MYRRLNSMGGVAYQHFVYNGKRWRIDIILDLENLMYWQDKSIIPHDSTYNHKEACRGER